MKLEEYKIHKQKISEYIDNCVTTMSEKTINVASKKEITEQQNFFDQCTKQAFDQNIDNIQEKQEEIALITRFFDINKTFYYLTDYIHDCQDKLFVKNIKEQQITEETFDQFIDDNAVNYYFECTQEAWKLNKFNWQEIAELDKILVEDIKIWKAKQLEKGINEESLLDEHVIPEKECIPCKSLNNNTVEEECIPCKSLTETNIKEECIPCKDNNLSFSNNTEINEKAQLTLDLIKEVGINQNQENNMGTSSVCNTGTCNIGTCDTGTCETLPCAYGSEGIKQKLQDRLLTAEERVIHYKKVNAFVNDCVSKQLIHYREAGKFTELQFEAGICDPSFEQVLEYCWAEAVVRNEDNFAYNICNDIMVDETQQETFEKLFNWYKIQLDGTVGIINDYCLKKFNEVDSEKIQEFFKNIPTPKNQYLEEFIIWSPLIFIFIILLGVLFFNLKNKQIHKIALYGTSLTFLFSLISLYCLNTPNYSTIKYNPNSPVPDVFQKYFFYDRWEFYLNPFSDLPMSFGIDAISWFFIILTNLFIFLCIFSIDYNLTRFKELIIYLFILQWGILCSFTILDLLGFFIFFETTLIPIFLIILIWGSRSRKVRASYLIAIYTLFGSVFMLFNILYISSKLGSTDYLFLITRTFSDVEQKFLWFTFFIAFAAKIPLFPMHIWLPEAHVEAPTLGSVLLAALLLKLGTYGIIRFCLMLFPLATCYYRPFIYLFAICGIIYTSLVAIRQIDLKKIIAYSSVGHMNVILLGLLCFQVEGLVGGIFQMLSHGIVSGALFFAVGVLYDRYKVRSLKYFGGLTVSLPLLSLIFLIFSMANISFPGTSSFVGEFLILLGVFNDSTIITFFASLSMILGAVYMLWTYNRIFFGNLKEIYIKKTLDLTRKEFYIFCILIFFLFLMGIFSYSLLNYLNYTSFIIIELSKNLYFC